MGGSGALDALASAVAALLGIRRVELVGAAGGTGNAAFRVVNPDLPGREPIAFVRAAVAPNEGSGLAHPLAREAELIRAASAVGLPVPQVLGSIADPPALVMSMVAGTSTPSPDEIEQVAAEYMGLIATLHRADPAEFPLTAAESVTDAIAVDFRRFQQRARDGGVSGFPLVRFGERVLELTMPQVSSRPVVLHGDAGAGNFMVHDGRVAAMLDWEISHVGDFHEDLAWMWMRGAHTSFGDPHARIAEYVDAANRPVDPVRLQWHVVYVMWKSVTLMYLGLHAPQGTDRTLLHYVVQLTYDALLCSAIGRLLGVSVPLLAEEPVAATSRQAQLASWVLTSAGLSREATIIVEHLRDKAAYAQWESDRFAQDARAIGIAPDDIDAEIESADLARLAQLAVALGAAADRAAASMPKAVRRIQRAQRIDLCD
jgi:aminoglycoside phosphotransferase (APT) family kinase protein